MWSGRIALLAALFACGPTPGGPGKPASAPRPASESQPAGRLPAGDEVRVEIIQAGRAPRRALRYRFAADRLGVMTTFFDMDIGYRRGEGPMVYSPSPPMEMDLELNGLTLERGVARGSHRITRFDVVTSPSDTTDERTRAAIRERLQSMVGMSGWMAMDDRGRMHGMGWDIPDSLAPEVRAILEGMSQSGKDMVVPLPEEPVGVGAEWYVVRETPFMGMKLANSSRVKLVTLDGDRITLRSETDMSAGNQPFAFPGLPAGTTAELLSFDGGGSGEIELDLGWLSPSRMSVQSRTEMTMEVTTGGQKEKVAVLARVTMEMKRR